MVVALELDGHSFTGLNGGPDFSEAITMQVNCADQKEIDYYWEKLGAGGEPKAQQCRWLKDKFGLSWQVVPGRIDEILTGGDAAGRERAMNAMLNMKKIDIAALERAPETARATLEQINWRWVRLLRHPCGPAFTVPGRRCSGLSHDLAIARRRRTLLEVASCSRSLQSAGPYCRCW